jgi:hypothetical protein
MSSEVRREIIARGHHAAMELDQVRSNDFPKIFPSKPRELRTSLRRPQCLAEVSEPRSGQVEFTVRSPYCLKSSIFIMFQQFKAVSIGLLIGCLLCFTNLYFGLQTGWISM